VQVSPARATLRCTARFLGRVETRSIMPGSATGLFLDAAVVKVRLADYDSSPSQGPLDRARNPAPQTPLHRRPQPGCPIRPWLSAIRALQVPRPGPPRGRAFLLHVDMRAAIANGRRPRRGHSPAESAFARQERRHAASARGRQQRDPLPRTPIPSMRARSSRAEYRTACSLMPPGGQLLLSPRSAPRREAQREFALKTEHPDSANRSTSWGSPSPDPATGSDRVVVHAPCVRTPQARDPRAHRTLRRFGWWTRQH